MSGYKAYDGYLTSLGLGNESSFNKEHFISRLNPSGENADYVKNEIGLLYSINRVLINQYDDVSLNTMLKIMDETDINVLSQLLTTYHYMSFRKLNRLEFLKEFKRLARPIYYRSKLTTESIKKEFDTTYNAVKEALLYSMSSRENVDELIFNCVKKSKNFIKKCNAENLAEIVFHIKNNYDLSDEDLIDISKKCATFFMYSSTKKIDAISSYIINFRKTIFKKIKVDQEDVILKDNFTEILKNKASIFEKNPKQVSDTIDFLLGKSIGQISEIRGKEAKIRGKFTSRELAKIFNESITSLNLSVERIKDITMSINRTFKNHYGEELDLTNFINGRNFSSFACLTKEDYLDAQGEEKLDKIFSILKEFFTKEEMKNALSNNISFMSASVNEIEKGIKEGIKNSKNNDELKKNLLTSLKNGFGKYKQVEISSDIKRNDTITIANTKVNIKELTKQELISLLNRLDANDSEIKSWESTWNTDLLSMALSNDIDDVKREIMEFIGRIYTSFESIDKGMEFVKTYQSDYDGLYDKYNELKKECSNADLKVKLNSMEFDFEMIKSLIDEKISNMSKKYNELTLTLNNGIKVR